MAYFVVLFPSGGSLRNSELLDPASGGVDESQAAAVLRHPTSSGSLEFMFSHILAFSFIPAFLTGLINARFKHKVAGFVWVVPTMILAYKFATFPSPSALQGHFSAAFHQYFAGGFMIREFRDWPDFWSIVRSTPKCDARQYAAKFHCPVLCGRGI